ncbi:MAG: hypothetical protein PHN53_01105 [Eubacteriales bacterium]|nr:hypothetical protein [Eubacteriales bacterium]MDD4139107.1 hypothetical protein [Eubacteriales bacterium]MDD4743168.1 hypothetical protein [Eubacteriales bacterium]
MLAFAADNRLGPGAGCIRNEIFAECARIDADALDKGIAGRVAQTAAGTKRPLGQVQQPEPADRPCECDQTAIQAERLDTCFFRKMRGQQIRQAVRDAA